MASVHPAVALLLLSGLAIYWLIPLTAWFILRGQNDRLSNIWFGGATAYAVTVTFFVFGASLPAWVPGPLASAIGLASVLCFVEALRQESAPKAPGRLMTAYLALVLAEFVLLMVLLETDQYMGLGRTLHLLLLAVIDMGVAAMAARVALQQRSRALWIVVTMFALTSLINLMRAGEYVLTGQQSGLLSLTPMANLGLGMNYLAGIFYCYGYWGFVLEKNRARLVQATEAAAEARARVQMAERIAAIGQAAQAGAMSAAITHEISQPLAAIRLNVEHVETLAQQALPGHPLHEPLGRVGHDIQRVVGIIQRMRRLFTRDTDADAVLDHPDQVVREVMELMRQPLASAGVTLELRLEGPARVRMAAGELEQVLLNLVNNALEAMAQAGTREPAITIRTWHEEGQMHLRCSDNGPGVPPELQASIFDMQFSTKRGNMGMGLWLSAYIVEGRGGRLQLEAQPTPGAGFWMSVPAG